MQNELLTLILQDLVIFPGEEIKLEFSNETSKKIIDKAINDYDTELMIVTPKNKLEISPSLSDLNDVGIKVSIKRKIILPNGNTRVTVRGIKRCLIVSKTISSGFIISKIETLVSDDFDAETESAYLNKIKNLVSEYIDSNSEVSNDIISMVNESSNLNKLVDILCASIPLESRDKQDLFEETDCVTRAKTIIKVLSSKIKENDLDKEIEEEIRNSFEQNEKDILIREKIRVLNKKLNDTTDDSSDVNYLEELNKLDLDSKTKKDIKYEIDRLKSTVDSSPEYSMLRSHLDFLLALPWNKSSQDKTNIDETFSHLNKLHYGMTNAKNRIEEYLILKNKNKDLPSPVLCLVGPPGTGKTTFARELAGSIGREFIKISVGGLNDSSELMGHRRTYLGASPGKILDGIRKCGVNNPIILIDEVDKMVKDFRADPASTLLDILDSNQNKTFIDNYAGIEFDLSNIIFILTANDIGSIPFPLRDRLEIIEVNSYTILDKINIAKKYTMPRLGKEYNFDSSKISFSDAVLTKIITEYTDEAGVRDLERNISSIVRKVLISGLKGRTIIKTGDVEKYLGNAKFAKLTNKYNGVGIANMASRTSNGGLILNVEAVSYPGKGLITSGLLGESTRESAVVALGYLKKNYKKFNIDFNKFKNAIHVHMLYANSRKDGTSGGLAITTALLSLFKDVKIPNDIAFTGEITLNGRILRVKGIEEKIISAYNDHIKKIYIPMDNIRDIRELSIKITKSINIIPINNFTEVYEDLFN